MGLLSVVTAIYNEMSKIQQHSELIREICKHKDAIVDMLGFKLTKENNYENM